MPITGNNGTGQVLDDSCGPNYDLQSVLFLDFGSFFDKYSNWWLNRGDSGCQTSEAARKQLKNRRIWQIFWAHAKSKTDFNDKI